MEESRAIPGGGGAAGPVAQQAPDPAERRIAGRSRGDERLEAEVGRRLAAGQMAGQLGNDALVRRGEPQGGIAVQDEPVATGHWCRRGCRVRLAALATSQQVAGELLRFLDIGLVERVDAENRAGDGRRHLPADGFRPQVDRVAKLDPDDRAARRLE